MNRNLLSSVAISLAALAAASCAPQPASAPPTSAPPPPAAAMPQPVPVVADVPPQLQPPPGSMPVLRANAHGAQIYACEGKAGSFAWAFKAPDALLDDSTNGRVAARHFAGPTWQAIPDNSMVVGETVASVPTANGQGVPWLLLRAKTHQGAGRFAVVSYIQRLDTVGGLSPALPCDAAHVGQQARIPYTATYVLYR